MIEQKVKSEVRDGMRIDWDVPIPMEDGIVLRADVFRPIDEGRYPVILSYGPYAKGLAFQEGYAPQWDKMVAEHPDVAAGSTNKYQNWEVVDPEKWVPDGYVCVRVDSRGAGRSPGVLDVWSPSETSDFHTCVEWAAAQHWSTGKVGLAGISYYAMNEYQVATTQPPHLAAICPWEGASDWYREVYYHGGILCTFGGRWFPLQVSTVQHGLGDRARKSPITGESVAGPETLSEEELARNRVDLGPEIKKHPLMDDWYRQRNPDWSKVTVPMLTAANWGGQGLHPRGNFEAFTQAASEQKWLEAHGLEHWTHFYTDYGVALQKRFFGHFLKGEDNGWDRQPKVQLQIRHADGRFVERPENEWPLARTRWTKLYLDTQRLTLGPEPVATEASVEYDALGEGVTFRLAIDEETEITGPMAAKLFIASSTKDADLFLVVRVFDPHGDEVTFQGALDPNTPVAQGWLRASHRKLDPNQSSPYRPYHAHDELQPLTRGETYELDVEIWPSCIVLPRGYRIALTVRGKDYEYDGVLSEFAKNFHYAHKGVGPFQHDDPADRPREVFGGKVTLYSGGGRQSYLLVPIIPARLGR
jgi:putative CocE/NonD family hydrolase